VVIWELLLSLITFWETQNICSVEDSLECVLYVIRLPSRVSSNHISHHYRPTCGGSIKTFLIFKLYSFAEFIVFFPIFNFVFLVEIYFPNLFQKFNGLCYPLFFNFFTTVDIKNSLSLSRIFNQAQYSIQCRNIIFIKITLVHINELLIICHAYIYMQPELLIIDHT